MAQQTTLALAAGFEKHQKVTRRAEFLLAMNRVVPWAELCAEIEPFYPKPGNGRPSGFAKVRFRGLVKPQPAVRELRAGQPGDRAEASAGYPRAIVSLPPANSPSGRTKTTSKADKRPKSGQD